MEKDIGKIRKNDNTEIVIRIDDFGGKTGLTIREFTTSERYTGFTKSGTRIPAESFKQFKDFIDSIVESDLAQPSSPKPEKKPEKPEKKQKTLAENQGEIDEEVF
ncbi:hypothetical protein J4456_01085 [Candidatus Pacearchaeota archaeon]|nr:hypothetical protein [Candidatus Pacearchaeota archaeon]